MAELRELVARALHQDRGSECYYADWRQCAGCGERADVVLAAIDIERLTAEARKEGRREALAGLREETEWAARTDYDGNRSSTSSPRYRRGHAARMAATQDDGAYVVRRRVLAGPWERAPVVGEERGEVQG